MQHQFSASQEHLYYDKDKGSIQGKKKSPGGRPSYEIWPFSKIFGFLMIFGGIYVHKSAEINGFPKEELHLCKFWSSFGKFGLLWRVKWPLNRSLNMQGYRREAQDVHVCVLRGPRPHSNKR